MCAKAVKELMLEKKQVEQLPGGGVGMGRGGGGLEVMKCGSMEAVEEYTLKKKWMRYRREGLEGVKYWI